jgi:hypothetical protein
VTRPVAALPGHPCRNCPEPILPGQPAAHRKGVPVMHLDCAGDGARARDFDRRFAPPRAVPPAPGADGAAEALAAAADAETIRCARCGAPATCVGAEPACDDCCSHDADEDPCWSVHGPGEDDSE